jgi:transcriptional regulator with XRE-family HTH domain
MIDFGKALRAAQEEQGLTSVELAKRFAVHKQQVSRWRYQKMLVYLWLRRYLMS